MTTYYRGEEVVEFESKCPVDDCDNNENIVWRHRGCGSATQYLNSDAVIICTNCGTRNQFYESKFSCYLHENYRRPSSDSQRLIAAFSIMGRLANGGGKSFLSKLMNNLIAQCIT